MRIATFNIMSGRSAADGRLVPERLAAAIAALDADVVALQEVDRNQPRSAHRDLAAEAAAAMNAVDYRYQPTVVGTPGHDWRPVTEAPLPDGAPTYGIALLTRLPISQWSTSTLRAAPVYGPVVVPGARGKMRVVPVRDEPRAVITAAIDRPAGRLLVAATHLSFIPGWNVFQARRVVKALAAQPAACRLLLGDLNVPGRAAAVATRWRRLADPPTWPAPDPRVQFDHVMADAPLRVTAAAALALEISDHRALVVELPDL